MSDREILLTTPLTDELVRRLRVGDQVSLSGKIYCGRDAVLPRICELIERGQLADYGIDLEGSLIFHSAVSPAGLGPTSSNKEGIESCFASLSRAGVKCHLGKGAIRPETMALLEEYQSVYAVIPPITALLNQKILSQKVLAFPELGMEAFYQLEVDGFPAIIAAAHNQSIFERSQA